MRGLFGRYVPFIHRGEMMDITKFERNHPCRVIENENNEYLLPRRFQSYYTAASTVVHHHLTGFVDERINLEFDFYNCCKIIADPRTYKGDNKPTQ
jgi:hypothetical protein